MTFRSLIAITTLLLAAPIASANNLKPVTLESWNAYIQSVNSEMDRRIDGQSTFLSLDKMPEFARLVGQGRSVVFPAPTGSPRKVPNGLIHDWTGDVFIPGAKIDEVLAILTDYDHYEDFYKPMVADSKVLERSGDQQRCMVVVVQRAFSVTAAIYTDNDVRTVRMDPQRAYSIATATQMQEIANFGKPAELRLPPDKGSGYLWRLQSIVRMEERDGGTYLEIETIGMSRDIPAAFRWLVKPLTEHIPRNRMLATLEDTRNAVLELRATETRAPETSHTLAGQ